MDIFGDVSVVTERDFVSILISLYRDSPELWNVKNKDYLNRNKRCAALTKILDVLKQYKPDYSEDQLKKKINIIRTNFNKECQKLEQKKRSGSSIDEVPGPTLWYFNELLFIKDQAEMLEMESFEQSLAEEKYRPSTSRGTKRKKKHPTPTDELVDLAKSYFKMPENEVDVVAKGWAMKLCRLAPDQRAYAEKIINDTLFEGEMGTLSRNGLCSQTSSPAPSISSVPTRLTCDATVNIFHK